MSPTPMSPVTFRRLRESDFPLLARWLEQPHVARWWNHETTPEAVQRDFGPAARREEPAEDLLAFVDARPVGLVQRCRLADYPEYLTEVESVVEVPDEAMSIDYLIGEPELVGHGLGPQVIRSILHQTWADHPRTTSIVVPVSAANRASWRALEKAGFIRVGTGEMEPDNPLDDRTHVVYRIDRTSAVPASPS